MKFENFSKKTITLVNIKYDINPFEIDLNNYKSANELYLDIYNKLPCSKAQNQRLNKQQKRLNQKRII